MAQEPWTAERLVALASGCWPTLTLHAGVTTGLLAALARDPLPATPAELAARLGLSPRGCDLLLQALAALGLLRAENGRYALVPAARAWFDPASPASLDQAVRHHADLVPRWARLADCVRSGAPLPRPAEGEDPTGREHFFLAMRDLARQLAPGLAARLAVKPASRLLDLAGSHGIYGPPGRRDAGGQRRRLRPAEAEPHFRAEAAAIPGRPGPATWPATTAAIPGGATTSSGSARCSTARGPQPAGSLWPRRWRPWLPAAAWWSRSSCSPPPAGSPSRPLRPQHAGQHPGGAELCAEEVMEFHELAGWAG